MSVSYDVFEEAFRDKVKDLGFLNMETFCRNSVVDGYMKRACAQFDKFCPYDLYDRDDLVREFKFDVSEQEIDELADIVSEGMLVQWMKPYVYKAENLENVLNTKDFTMYSPSELLHRISEAYNTAKKDFTQMMREYSYNHGDLSDLHL